MADEEQLLAYIIKGQDQTRALLEQHAQLLERIATSANAMAKAVEDAGKKTEEAAPKVNALQKFLQDFVGNTDNASNAAKNFSGVMSDALKNPTALMTQFGSTLGESVTGPIGLAIGASAALATGLAILSKELIGVTRDATEMGASFDDMSRKTQASVAGLSSLDFATKALGASTTSMVNAIYTLQQRIETNPAQIQRGLEELNKSTSGVKITFDKLNEALRTDGVQGLLLLSDAFSTVSKNVDTAAAVGDIFTKRFGKDILPALTRDLRALSEESKTLGYTWTAEDAAAAKELEIAVNKLELQLTAIAMTIGKDLMPIARIAAADFAAFLNLINGPSENRDTPWGQMVDDLRFIVALLERIGILATAVPKIPEAPALFQGSPNFAGPDITGGSGVAAEALSAARLKSIMNDLHAQFELHKKDLYETSAIAKETINAQLAGQIALINQTESGFQAQIDIAQKTHAAHVAIIATETQDKRKQSADFAAEDELYAATKQAIENKANKALQQLTIATERELAHIHEDANASWLTKRLDVIAGEHQAQLDSLRQQFGDIKQFNDAVALANTVNAAKIAAANSQYNKKLQQEITRVADDIEIARVNAMENGLAKQIELINQRIQKEKDAAVRLQLTDQDLAAYRAELAEKGAVEIENARIADQRRLNDELFSLESDYQSSVNTLARSGTAVQLAQLEIQRTAVLRDIQLHKQNNQELIDAANKAFDAQADVIKRQGVLTKQQYDDYVAETLAAYQMALAAGVETAEQLEQRWHRYWESQHKAQIDYLKTVGDLTDATARFFRQVADAAGPGGLGSFAKGIADVASSIGPAIAAANKLAETMSEIDKKGMSGTGFANMATGALNFVSAATQSQSVIGSAIAGFVSTIQFGLATALAAAAASALITAWENAAKDDDAKAAAAEVGILYGRRIGLALGKSLHDTMQELHVSAQVAAALNIDKILQEAGGLSSKAIDLTGTTHLPGTTDKTGFQQTAEAIGVLLKEVAKNGQDVQLALDAINNSFGKLVTFMDQNLHGLVNPEMVQLILNSKEAGQNIEAITQFLSQMAVEAEKGINLVVGGFAGPLNTAWKGIEDSTKKIVDLEAKGSALVEKMSKLKVGSEEWNDLKRQLDDINKQFADLLPAVERWRKQLEAAGGDVTGLTERADRMGRLLNTTFAVAIASGQSFIKALDAIQPGLQQLVALQEHFGLKVSDTLQHLLDLSNWGKNNKELADSLDGLNQLMKGLANSGAVTQQTFTDLGDEAAAQFRDIMASGLSQDDAFKAMQPTLQTLYELQKRFGYQVDATTQSLLDEAEKSGAVGSAHESAAERTVTAMNHVADILELIAKAWGITIPATADAAGAHAMTTADKIAKSHGAVITVQRELTQRVHDTADAFDEMGAHAAEAADKVSAGQKKVIYGSSPGGLDDLLRHLQDVIDQFNHLGDAGARNMDNVAQHTKEYIKTLVDLNRQLQLDVMGSGLAHDLKALEFEFTAKWEALKEQFKNEPLGLDEAYQALLADFNIRKAKITADFKKNVADQEAAVQKTRNDDAYARQQQAIQAQIELTKQGLDKTLALLNLQKAQEIKSLQDRFAAQASLTAAQNAANAAFIQEQIAVIEGIYGDKIAKAIKDNNEAIAKENEKILKQQSADAQKLIDDALKAMQQLQDAFLKSMQSLEDELQDVILGTMEDGVDKQLAIMQVQKQRRLRALAEQFGAESNMYRQQAAILDQIYGIQAGEITASSGSASLSTLQKAFYAIQNSPVQPGQESARQADLDRLSAQIQAAQAAYLSNATSGIPAGLLPANIGVASQFAGLTAGGTVRLEVVITDPAGNELNAVDFSSIEEAIATGRITLVARNSSQRSG